MCICWILGYALRSYIGQESIIPKLVFWQKQCIQVIHAKAWAGNAFCYHGCLWQLLWNKGLGSMPVLILWLIKKSVFFSSECIVFFFIGLAGILGLMLVSANAFFNQTVTRFMLAWKSGYHTTQGVTPGLHLLLIPETVFILPKCIVCCLLLSYASLWQVWIQFH